MMSDFISEHDCSHKVNMANYATCAALGCLVYKCMLIVNTHINILCRKSMHLTQSQIVVSTFVTLESDS